MASSSHITKDAVEASRETALLEGANRGAALMVASLAFVAAARGTAFAEKLVLRSVDLGTAHEIAAIVTSHAMAAPTLESLQACASELVAWLEKGN